MKISRTLRILSSVLAAAMCLNLNITYGVQRPELPVAPNTKLSLELLSPISTATSKKGDKFSCKVLTPAEYAGAVVEGHIRNLKRSGKADKESKMDLAFDRVTLPDGRSEDFGATVVEVFDVANVSEQGRADSEGTLRSKPRTVKISVKRAVAGALIGAVIGGVVAGGQGAAVGAAIGAGVGVTTTLATKGPDLEFKEGTQFTVECTGPTRKKNETRSAKANVVTPSEPPSQTYRLFIGNGFTASLPDNWRESPISGSLSFAPAGGMVDYQGRPNLTHGAMIGVVPSQTQDLRRASDRLVGALLQANAYLKQQGAYVSSLIGARDALSATLSGIPAVTGREENVAVHTAMLTNGSVFYLITVVPEEDFKIYREAFDHVMRSITFQ